MTLVPAESRVQRSTTKPGIVLMAAGRTIVARRRERVAEREPRRQPGHVPDRVQAEILADNTGSQRVLERNGFYRIGMAPAYLRINGRWQDHVLFQALNPAMS